MTCYSDFAAPKPLELANYGSTINPQGSRTADCFLLHYPRTMNVATIKVGRRGQIKHILPSKQSSLNQKTNFRTMIMPFCFLFRFLPFFSKKIWVPQFPEVPWSVHPKFSNTLHGLRTYSLNLLPLRT